MTSDNLSINDQSSISSWWVNQSKTQIIVVFSECSDKLSIHIMPETYQNTCRYVTFDPSLFTFNRSPSSSLSADSNSQGFQH